MLQHFRKLATRAPAGARSSLAVGTVAAIAAVCVFSGTLVGSELVGGSAIRAKTPVAAWALEPRWWPGELPQAVRSVSTRTEPDLTFSKGYAQRVAARAAQAARIASLAQPAEAQLGRPAIVTPKPSLVARAETRQDLHRLAAASSETDGLGDRTGALAFDDPSRPRESSVPRGLFGTLFGGRDVF